MSANIMPSPAHSNGFLLFGCIPVCGSCFTHTIHESNDWLLFVNIQIDEIVFSFLWCLLVCYASISRIAFSRKTTSDIVMFRNWRWSLLSVSACLCSLRLAVQCVSELRRCNVLAYFIILAATFLLLCFRLQFCYFYAILRRHIVLGHAPCIIRFMPFNTSGYVCVIVSVLHQLVQFAQLCKHGMAIERRPMQFIVNVAFIFDLPHLSLTLSLSHCVCLFAICARESYTMRHSGVYQFVIWSNSKFPTIQVIFLRWPIFFYSCCVTFGINPKLGELKKGWFSHWNNWHRFLLIYHRIAHFILSVKFTSFQT